MDQFDSSTPPPRGYPLRTIWSNISAMANNPWGSKGSGPGKGNAGGNGSGDGGGDAPPPRNPWTDPPAPGGRPRGPTALDELLKRRPRGGGGGNNPFGGGGMGKLPGGAKAWGWAAAGVALLFVGASMVHIIPPQNEGVVTRLGSYVRTVSPGIHITLPFIERVEQEDVRQIRTLPVGSPNASDENFVLTRDQNIIDLAYEVRWTIRDPERFLFQLADREGTIREVAETAMRAAVANFDLIQAIGPGRSDIEADVQRRMQAILNEYGAGVLIQGIAIRQADPPDKVNEAFKEVTSARQERESALNNARAYAQRVLEGARGETAEFDRIYEEYRLAPQVTRQRLYYETMEQVLSQVDKTIVETPGVTPFLPLRELQRQAAPAPAPATTSGGQ